MNKQEVTVEQLMTIIGDKEVQLALLRGRLELFAEAGKALQQSRG